MRGVDRYAAREAMVKDLDEQGLLVKVVPHKHNVGQCYRCGTTVEPLTSKQWFVKMKPLAEPALKAVLDGKDKLYSRTVLKDIYTLDGKRSRLVYLASALVGTSYSCVLLRKVRRDNRFKRRV